MSRPNGAGQSFRKLPWLLRALAWLARVLVAGTVGVLIMAALALAVDYP